MGVSVAEGLGPREPGALRAGDFTRHLAFCQVLSSCNPDETLIDSASLTNLQVSEEPPIALEAWERTEFSKKETLEIQSPIWRA